MIPPEPGPPATIGAQPTSAYEVSSRVGNALKEFVRVKSIISQDQDWLLGADLKAPPYYYTEAQELDTKTAIAALDSDLDAVDMTFINRLLGLV